MIDSPRYNNILSLGQPAHEAFERCVQRNKNEIALKYNERSISYDELNKRANKLAHQIISQNIKNQPLIAISLERSPEMIIAILAVMKAGYAYVPIDPNSPEDRISFILRDTAAPAIITTESLQNSFQKSGNGIVITVNSESLLDNHYIHNPKIEVQENDLAYCIYTSGSTGKPKGVLIEHKSLINLIKAEQNFFQHPIKKFLFTYSFAFDGSVLLIFKTLLDGATLVIGKSGVEKDIHQIATLIQKESISHLLTFPSLYTILLEHTESEALKSLESVSVAGEACPGALVQLHHKTIPQANFYNQYGPTEATVGASIYKTSSNHSDKKTPIGTPIDNVQIYLLDEQQKKVTKGEIGEIYIGGIGVARGYLNRPKLNKTKFISNPFGEGRLYKTGDLARLLGDGNLDFIGRADFQVKLRGYRIELGEIEANLLQHENLREVVVLLTGEKAESQKLVAYFVTKKGISLETTELRKFLEKQLPAYMIPAQFVSLEQMPVTNRGKVDRKTLVALSSKSKQKEINKELNHFELEKLIFDKWKKILQIDQIEYDDKFFEIGGNSLLAARFIAELQKELEENIFITSIFENPTITTFAEMLRRDYAETIRKRFSNEKSNFQKSQTIPSLKKSDFKNFQNFFPKVEFPRISIGSFLQIFEM